MKRQLMVGTALAAATMLVAGGALAADKKMMKLSILVNGYYEGVVGGLVSDEQSTKYSYTGRGSDDGNVTTPVNFASPLPETAVVPKAKQDDVKDTSALDTKTDAEIHFNGRATLDSGMKIHMRVELEGQYNHSTGDPIDEYFLSVSGSFGQIILGGTENAPTKMLARYSGSWATGVGDSLSFEDHWVPSAAYAKDAGGGGDFEVMGHSRLSSGDGEKITYISPALGGFQVGLTYEPRQENNDDNSRVDARTDKHDGIAGAASYSGKFGDVGFGMGFGMMSYKGGTGDKAEPDPIAKGKDGGAWIAAAKLNFGPATLAAAYKKTTDPKVMRGNLVDLGVKYVQGANSFSITGMAGKMDENDARHTKAMASYARALGPGVKVHANLIWSQSESQKKVGMRYDAQGAPLADQDAADVGYVQETSTSENSGVALVTGITVNF